MARQKAGFTCIVLVGVAFAATPAFAEPEEARSAASISFTATQPLGPKPDDSRLFVRFTPDRNLPGGPTTVSIGYENYHYKMPGFDWPCVASAGLGIFLDRHPLGANEGALALRSRCETWRGVIAEGITHIRGRETAYARGTLLYPIKTEIVPTSLLLDLEGFSDVREPEDEDKEYDRVVRAGGGARIVVNKVFAIEPIVYTHWYDRKGWAGFVRAEVRFNAPPPKPKPDGRELVSPPEVSREEPQGGSDGRKSSDRKTKRKKRKRKKRK